MTDLFTNDPVPVEEKIAVLRRELAMRKSVYPRLVTAGKMKPEQAERGMAVIVAIMRDYEAHP